jgi:hypothetical protein
MQVSVKYVCHSVCIYRCIHLKTLALCWCWEITDAGISMVICHCNQLRMLDLLGVVRITGVYSL